MSEAMDLTPQSEDYLEAIFRAIAQKGIARAGEISRRLSVHKSTVTAALKGLAEKGLVNYAPYEPVTLTPAGRRVAEEVSRRHEAIQRFLVDVLAVGPAAADENACRMEHAMDSDVADRLLRFMDFVKRCPRGGEKWIRGYRHFCEEGPQGRHCEPCIEGCLADYRRSRAGQDQEGTGTMTTLDQLKPGEKGKIVRVGGKGGVARRIADMGVVRGTPVEVLRVAPLGDPIQIKVKGYDLSLRKEEAAAIRVEQS